MLLLLNVTPYTLFQCFGPVAEPKLYVLVTLGIKFVLILAVTVSVLLLLVPITTLPFNKLVPDPVRFVVVTSTMPVTLAEVVLTYTVAHFNGVVLLPKSYVVASGTMSLLICDPKNTVS